MRGTIKSRLTRFAFNLFPCYRRTGARITYVSPDMDEVHIKLPLNWKTRGYNGTIFGGSLYACIDPVYMTMISWNLGREYIAWDRAATIDFRKAARATLYSKFKLKPEELDSIRADLETAERTERVYDVELADAGGTVHATFKKTIVIRKRKPK
jgi:acyl-coenzyme A thioesterase PaaI-like protein